MVRWLQRGDLCRRRSITCYSYHILSLLLDTFVVIFSLIVMLSSSTSLFFMMFLPFKCVLENKFVIVGYSKKVPDQLIEGHSIMIIADIPSFWFIKDGRNKVFFVVPSKLKFYILLLIV